MLSESSVRPSVLEWELTRSSIPVTKILERRCELPTYEAHIVINQIAHLRPYHFVLTGERLFNRPDVYELIDYARRRGLSPELDATVGLLPPGTLDHLKRSGLASYAVSLHAPQQDLHDLLAGKESFDWTLDTIRYAKSIGLQVRVVTPLDLDNLPELDALIALLSDLRVDTWTIELPLQIDAAGITSGQTERFFEDIYELSALYSPKITLGEAPHFRRFVLQQALGPGWNQEVPTDSDDGVVLGVVNALVNAFDFTWNDARNGVFVSNRGKIFPSRHLRLPGGTVRCQTLRNVFANSPVFLDLRDRSKLKGKCARCDFRNVCGGSRVRAFLSTGDRYGSDPLCAYQPKEVS